MNSLLTAMITFAALAVTLQGQETPPQPKITGVLVIITAKNTTTVQKVMNVMPAEIRATVACIYRARSGSGFRAAMAKA